MNTERLVLMPIRRAQILALLDGAIPEGVPCGGAPLDTALLGALRAMASAKNQKPAQAEWYSLWLLADAKTREAVGFAGFPNGPDGAGFATLCCCVGERSLGNGHADEGIRALCDWAFDQPGISGVFACPGERESSLTDALKSCGFQMESENGGPPRWRLGKPARFVCPVCRGQLSRTPTGLSCGHGHSFDRARQGYVNLLRKKPDTFYEDKALFAARRRAFSDGFFDPLLDAMRIWLPSSGAVLDAGCGEGSLLTRLCGPRLRGMGLDISREAVRMAAAAYKAADWCVGDLCDIPLGDRAVDAVINVLTPANYAEFARVLRPGGLLLKAVPNEGHLAEVRAASGIKEMEPARFEPESTHSRRFFTAESKRICYAVACDEALAQAVFEMTPMTRHAKRREISAGDITVDVTLWVGTLHDRADGNASNV